MYLLNGVGTQKEELLSVSEGVFPGGKGHEWDWKDKA